MFQWGLESGKRYCCRVTTIGSHGAPATSKPVSRMVIEAVVPFKKSNQSHSAGLLFS